MKPRSAIAKGKRLEKFIAEEIEEMGLGKATRVGLVDDELEYIEIEDLVDDGVYYCTSCYKDLSLSDDEVIEILKSNN